MRKICFVSGSRADYGLLHNLMRLTKKSKKTKLQLIVTGTHLSSKFGNTYKEIEEDGFSIDSKIRIDLKKDNPSDINKAAAEVMAKISNSYKKLKPDIIILLGDRFEMLSSAFAALSMQIPIAHIHGGESSFGSIDEAIRHSITKMSICHFVSTSIYKKRVIQLGEHPSRVFNLGALATDRIKKLKLFSKKEIEKKLKFKFNKKNILITFHPATLDENNLRYLKQIFLALNKIKDANKIFTIPNADSGGVKIDKMIKNYVKKNKKNCLYFKSLGQKMYFSVVKNVDLVLGNSSSGIIETPLLKKPSINIGDRQLGRVKCDSTLDAKPNNKDILRSIKKTFSKSFLKDIEKIQSPYEKINTSKNIFNILINLKIKGIIKKKFYDM